MVSVCFILLGCDKNRIDAEIMAQRLADDGFLVVQDPKGADVVIVNTCGFIDSAKEQAIDTIFDMIRLKESGEVGAVLVTGCLAQRYEKEVRMQIPEADGVVGIAHNADIVSIVREIAAGKKAEYFGSAESLTIEGRRMLSTPPHYAYVKIAEGCSNRCTYCAIPSIRGRYRSRAMRDILRETQDMVLQGVREVILVAQDTTSYGQDLNGGETLTVLLQNLCAIEGLWKVRILYAYPERITEELIRTMASGDKIARYLDIPLQHACAAVLKRMGRAGNAETLLATLRRLRTAMPDITLRSTFIVGFPGETQQQFEELLTFLDEAQLDRAGCFAYSQEDGTSASRLDGQLDDRVKKYRTEAFEARQQRIMLRGQARQIGRKLEVICDGYDVEAGAYVCRSEADAPEIDTVIFLPTKSDLMPGDLYRVRITEAQGADLAAVLDA